MPRPDCDFNIRRFIRPSEIIVIDTIMQPMTPSNFLLIMPIYCLTELQGHAIKNQDLLIAAGTISLKGSEGMSAVDDDVEAAVRDLCPRCICT